MIEVNEMAIDGKLDEMAEVLARFSVKEINRLLDVLEDKVAETVLARRPPCHIDPSGVRAPYGDLCAPFVRECRLCPSYA